MIRLIVNDRPMGIDFCGCRLTRPGQEGAMVGVYSDGATGLAGVYTIGHGKHWHGRGMGWLGQGWGVHHVPCRAPQPACQAAHNPLVGNHILYTFCAQAGRHYHHDQT